MSVNVEQIGGKQEQGKGKKIIGRGNNIEAHHVYVQRWYNETH
jgi:hypothetical protein